MKLKSLTLCLLFGALFASCIKDELPNAEADILSCVVPSEILIRDPVIENDKITVRVKSTDLTNIAPEFTLTPGATIVPASGTARDFTTPQAYMVTSEDGNWHKTYTVTFIYEGLSTQYSFEDMKLQQDKYPVFFERNGDKVIMDWASGNIGYAILGMAASPEEYPTAQGADGVIGKCLKLSTRSTGGMGAMMNMPMAAGNLFIGTFDAMSALSNPLKATQFGLPFYYEPTRLTGYYKYEAGKDFTEGGIIVPGKKDIFDIYAIFYETDEVTKTLDGTNTFTHPNLISIARISNAKETKEWVRFSLPFVYLPGKSVDKAKLAAGKYNLAIVFASSLEGAKFNGAFGSTLQIDEVKLLYNETK